MILNSAKPFNLYTKSFRTWYSSTYDIQITFNCFFVYMRANKINLQRLKVDRKIKKILQCSQLYVIVTSDMQTELIV